MGYRTRIAALLAVAGVAGAPAAAEAAPKLKLSSASVQAGDSLRVRGLAWPRQRGVSLHLRHGGGARRRVALVRTDGRGRFSTRVRIAAGASAGRYTLVACTAGCRRTRRVSIRVARAAQPAPAPPTAPPAAPPAAATPQLPRLGLAEWQALLGNVTISQVSSTSTFGGSFSEYHLTLCADGRFGSFSEETGNGLVLRSQRVGTWRIENLLRDSQAGADQAELRLVVADSSAADFDPDAPEAQRLAVEVLRSFDDGRFHCCGDVPAQLVATSSCG